MNSCKNSQRTKIFALLSAITLHLALIAAATAWLTPPATPDQPDPVLSVTLRSAASVSSPVAVAALTAPDRKPKAVPQVKTSPLPQRPKAIPKSVPKIVPQQKAQPGRPTAAQVPGLPNQPQILAAPTAPPQSQPQQQIARSEPSSTQNHAPDAPPAGTPEAPPIAAKSGVTSVTSVTIPAAYAARNRKPDYPLLSRRYNEQGTVVLRVLVNAGGTAGAVHIKQSSGYPLLDQSALAAAQEWRFVPATKDGKPVSEWYEISIPYTLQD